MKYNNMICDVELLKKSSLKINEISKTGDEIIRMMQTQIESIANDHWTGEESRKYLAEYDVLQNSYNRLKSRLTWMEQTMELFAIKVEDFDNKYQAKFRQKAYASVFEEILKASKAGLAAAMTAIPVEEPKAPIANTVTETKKNDEVQKANDVQEKQATPPGFLESAIHAVKNNTDYNFDQKGHVFGSNNSRKTVEEIILDIMESTPDLNTFEVSFLLESVTWLGTDYALNTMTKGKSADCSGFVKATLASLDRKFTARSSKKIWADSAGKVIQNKNNFSEKGLRPGDVIFYDTLRNGKRDGNVDHVGFYLGNGWTIQTWGKDNGVVILKNGEWFLTKSVVGVKRYQ